MSVPNPAANLMKLINGFWMTQAVYVAAQLGIADLLAGGPRTACDLASAVAVQPQPLHRLLRALASVGVFEELDGGLFGLTPMADVLRSDASGSLRPMALMRGQWQYGAWGELLHCVTTGGSAFEKLFGQPMFDFLSTDPDRGALFDAAMTAIHGRETSLLLDAFDFGSIERVIDIGGGNGSLLAEILRRHPGVKGTLFDLPPVIERAQSNAALHDVRERIEFASGSFFESIPSGGDIYVMRHIIHDWNDEQSTTILKHCRAAMSPTARLLIAEFVIPPGNGPFVGKWFDLAMLVGPGGQERTAAEYELLLSQAGLRMSRIIPTAGEISFVEAVPP